MSAKEKKKDVRVPRRASMKLSKGEAKSMALEAISNALEGTLASSLVEGFTVRMLREHKRAPTEGERNTFLEQVARVSEGLRGRVKG